MLRHAIPFLGAQNKRDARSKSFMNTTCMMCKRLLLFFVLCGISWSVLVSDACAEDQEKVNQLKAAFIYNFIKYVQWPEDTKEDVIVVGILGEDPVVKPLQEIAKKRKVKGKKLVIKVFSDGEPFHPCQIIFVSANRVDDLDASRKELEAAHVLLVGDTKGFIEKGVAVNFVLSKERLRFQVSQKALTRAKLVIGAQMLKLAILVDE